MPFDDDDSDVLRHWLCPRCRAPQSSALAICLECGSRRPVAPVRRAPRRRLTFTSVLLGLMLVVTWWLAAAGAA